MLEFKKIYLVAFFVGLAMYAIQTSLQIAGPGSFFKMISQSKAQTPVGDVHSNAQDPNTQVSVMVKGLHPNHDVYVDKLGDSSGSRASDTTLKTKPDKNKAANDLASQSQELHSSRALVSRDEWDQVKSQKPEIILYFMDRYPREIAEEIINAFR
ncbi:MAG: hypothetical protein ACK5V3_03930 [Bdellovibrionales bacterium]